MSDDTVVLGLAAIAAVAAVIGVLQNRRTWRASRFPELQMQVSDRDPTARCSSSW